MATAVLQGCAHTLPAPPSGDLYSVDWPDGVALCSTLGTGATCPSIPMSTTDRFFMLPPATYQELMNYIDELINEIDTGASPTMVQPDTSKKSIQIKKQDLLFIKAQMTKVRENLQSQE